MNKTRKNEARSPVNPGPVRVLEIQFMRGLAILVILMVHAAGDFSHVVRVDENIVARALFYALTSFGVPIFILISGFVLYHRYGHQVSVRDFYSRRFKKVLIPYAIFSVIYIAFSAWENGWLPSKGKCLWMILTGTSYYHLWFVRLIVQIYLLYPFLAKLYRRFEEVGKVRWLLGGSLVLQTLINAGILIAKQVSSSSVDEVIDVVLVFTGFIFYFFLGMWAARNRKKLGSIVDAFAERFAIPAASLYALAIFIHVRVLLWGLEGYGSQAATPDMDKIPIVFTRIITQMFTLIVSYQVARFLMRRPGVGAPVLLHIGRLSYGFYLVHPLMLGLAARAMETWFSIGTTSVFSFPINFTLTALSTYLVVSWINRSPLSEWLLGKEG